MKVKNISFVTADKFYYADGQASVGDYHPAIKIELFDTGQNIESVYFSLTSDKRHGAVSDKGEPFSFNIEGVFRTKIRDAEELKEVRNELYENNQIYKANNIRVGSKLEYHSKNHKIYINDNVAVYEKGNLEPTTKSVSYEKYDSESRIKALNVLERVLKENAVEYYKGEAFKTENTLPKDSLETKFYDVTNSFNFELGYSLNAERRKLEDKEPISRKEYAKAFAKNNPEKYDEISNHLANDAKEIELLEKKQEYFELKKSNSRFNPKIIELLQNSELDNKWEEKIKSKDEQLQELAVEIKDLELQINKEPLIELEPDYDDLEKVEQSEK